VSFLVNIFESNQTNQKVPYKFSAILYVQHSGIPVYIQGRLLPGTTVGYNITMLRMDGPEFYSFAVHLQE
jgi:hypothetical protein